MTKVAVVSFPGNNCEVESLRALRRNGMEPVFFRWNDDTSLLKDVDGYFIPGGFSYEDRGRAGMIAGRDRLMAHIAGEAAQGKVVIGNCNGAQILIESGLVPLGAHLDMCLARNVVDDAPLGFVSEWVHITPSCPRDRCATSGWEGVMHLPIAHGEGRFVTRDADLFGELKKNNQIAFSYCDAGGNISGQYPVTPNGSTCAAAGICNPAGNVIALMPHPERTPNGDPYFRSMKGWIENKRVWQSVDISRTEQAEESLSTDASELPEIFIDTIIVNNEERSVEQALQRVHSGVRLKQLRYLRTAKEPADLLRHLSFFNPNKETAYVRRGTQIYRWSNAAKAEEAADGFPFSYDILLLRTDLPETAERAHGKGAKGGICYAASGLSLSAVTGQMRAVFANPNASRLTILS